MDTCSPNSSSVRFSGELKIVAALARATWKLIPSSHRTWLIIASFMMSFISMGYVGIALLLGRLVDNIGAGFRSENHAELIRGSYLILLLMAGIYLVREALNVLRRVIIERSCTRLNCDLQRRVVEHVMKFDLETLSKQKLGSLHGRIFRSVDGLVHFVRLMFLECLPAVFIGVFAISTSIYKEPFLGVIMLGVVPVSLYLTVKQLNSQKGVRLKLMRDCENIDGIVIEQLGGIEYIRVADTLKSESSRLGAALEKRREFELRHHIQMSIYGCGKALNESAFHLLLLAIATKMAISNQISVGDVMTFSVLFYNVMSPLNEVHRILDQGHESSLKVSDLMDILGTPQDCSFKTDDSFESSTDTTCSSTVPVVEMKNVHATYGQDLERRPSALKQITLKIDRGETVGIAGYSGSGKSTWAKVLLRLLHSDKGDVFLEGKSLGRVSRSELARRIGYVGQHPFVFSGTISQNIAYGCGDVTDQQIVQAAKLTHFHNDIVGLLGGYDAVISERGQNLSGGQRQRIALARAVLKNPPILILDEATSALDNITERMIQNSLGLDQGSRTTIMIAHRLSTLRECDRIFVFENGQIIETGSYIELVSKGGLFASLVSSGDARSMASIY